MKAHDEPQHTHARKRRPMCSQPSGGGPRSGLWRCYSWRRERPAHLSSHLGQPVHTRNAATECFRAPLVRCSRFRSSTWRSFLARMCLQPKESPATNKRLIASGQQWSDSVREQPPPARIHNNGGKLVAQLCWSGLQLHSAPALIQSLLPLLAIIVANEVLTKRIAK